jgi:predicted ATPase
MRFAKIRLENWRNFALADVELERRVFLVGPNASGKSNFLDAFRFLHDIVEDGFTEAVLIRGGISRLRCLAARRYSDLLIKVTINGDRETRAWEYELRFTQDNRQRPIVKGERVSLNGNQILDRPDEADRSDAELMTQTHLQQVNANQRFREVADFFASVKYLHIVPQLVREPDRSVGRKNDPYGGDFLEQIAATPERTRVARLRRIQDALKVAVPQMEELELSRDGRGTPHLRGKYEHWRPQGAWQTEEQFSDGTLRLLGLLWAVLDGTGPLLLEEPELSLHPEVVRFIPQMFARIQRKSGRQLLLSTSSSDLLRDEGIGIDEVLLLQPKSEGTAIAPARRFRDVVELLEGGLSLADIVIPKTRPSLVQQLALFGD